MTTPHGTDAIQETLREIEIRVQDSANCIDDIATEVSQYPCVTYLDDVQLSDGLLSGSIQNAAVVACSDMKAGMPFVCSEPHVPLFLFQNFGHHFDTGGLVETITESGIKHVVVYGHSACDYTESLVKSDKDLNAADEEQRRLYATVAESDSETDWKIVGQYRVLKELQKMLADPAICSRIEKGQLHLHGWFYNAASRQIEVFDPKQKAFITVTKVAP